MQVAALMRSNGNTAGLSTTVVEIARMMSASCERVVPVADKGRFVGLVTDWDISCRAVMCGKDLESMTVRDVMPAEQAQCAESLDLEQAAALLDRGGLHGLAVCDAQKKLLGWVHRDDIGRMAG